MDAHAVVVYVVLRVCDLEGSTSLLIFEELLLLLLSLTKYLVIKR